MPRSRLRQLLLGALGLPLAACAAAPGAPPAAPGPPSAAGAAPSPGRPPGAAAAPAPAPAPPPPSPRQELAAAHGARARELERGGQLRRALEEWRIALTIDPADAVAQAGRRQLEARIEQTIAERMTQARQALARNDHLEARRHLLAVLALDPAHAAAFEALQNEVKEIRFVTHTVKAGETLATIAERYYGDRARSEVIWETNQLPPNPRLAAGTVLKIPEIPGVPFVLPELRPRPPVDTATRPEAAPAETGGRPAETVEIDPLLVGAREALDKGEYQVALADVDKVLA
ncbi:MAG TPA: LysM peptidoglycan-binding domain-containing protein, partial [Methylomirabilota bacterium]|nr:LysM peptidoglycan-binding domain-containing protein [Methylomirabilota bacterium]